MDVGPGQERHESAPPGPAVVGRVPVLAGDPLALSRPDPHPDGDRWRTVGSAAGVVVLFVVHTEPTAQPDGREVGRVISVRRATPHERRAYEEESF